MFYSTRDRKIQISASQAILKGLSDDGGLFLPDEIPSLKIDASFLSLSYKELAFKVLSLYLDDFSKEDIQSCLEKAYDRKHFENQIMAVKTFGSFSFMELFHGETLTFKDMALSLLPYLMEVAKNKHPEAKSIKILTATSGDTGSAVLSSFSKVKGVDVSILYPDFGVAPIQEKQMLYFTNDHARAYALKKSNFDTCQSLVKKLLISGEKNGYTSANSINIGRLLPQIVYYFYTYLQLVKNKTIALGEKVDFVVPTGNFGDIFAGYLAKRMSLPVGKLVVASNENRILTDFFKTGVYDLNRQFIKTNSPSMDILISSNLERLLYLTLEDDKKVVSLMKDLKENKKFIISKSELSKLNEDFIAYSAKESDTNQAILSCYQERQYLLDPHSAVGYSVFKQYQKSNPQNHVVLVLTASPLKFPATICKALHLPYQDDLDALAILIKETSIPLPAALKKVLDCYTPKFALLPSQVKNELFKEQVYFVKTPATSANLGPGFDVMGLALDIYNTFSFKKNDVMKTEGFPDLGSNPNLVLTSYEYLFKKLNLETVPVLIKEETNDIPVSRGLGSSSSCILAGLLGANAILKNKVSLEKIYEMAVEIEGHPDNVGPCLFGGVIANLKANDEYRHFSLKVAPNYRFLLVIPNTKVSTQMARSILPKEYPLSTVVKNTSHAALLPLALAKGDLNLLREVLKDDIHVPYRKTLIKEYERVSNLAEQYQLPMTISGSGSTMIVFYLAEEEKKILNLQKDLYKDFSKAEIQIKTASLNTSGSLVQEEQLKYE
jgi:threonine synthase